MKKSEKLRRKQHRIKKSSEEAAAQIIADGKKESKVLLEDAEKKGTETYKAAIAFAEAKAEESYQKKIDSEAVLCEQLKASARENLMQAASAIVGKVVGTYGND